MSHQHVLRPQHWPPLMPPPHPSTFPGLQGRRELADRIWSGRICSRHRNDRECQQSFHPYWIESVLELPRSMFAMTAAVRARSLPGQVHSLQYGLWNAVAPYFQNFDAGFDEGTGTANTGSTIDPCWSRNPTTAITGEVVRVQQEPRIRGLRLVIPAGLATIAHGGQLHKSWAHGRIETPDVDLSPLTLPELRFWYTCLAGVPAICGWTYSMEPAG